MSHDITIGTGSKTREENVHLRFEFDYAMYTAAAQLIEKLCGWRFEIGETIPQPGDAVSYHYSFCIGYFGDVEKNLDQALTLLCQMDMAMIEVDTELLDKTTCLLARLVEKLRQMQTMVTPREA